MILATNIKPELSIQNMANPMSFETNEWFLIKPIEHSKIKLYDIPKDTMIEYIKSNVDGVMDIIIENHLDILKAKLRSILINETLQ